MAGGVKFAEARKKKLAMRQAARKNTAAKKAHAKSSTGKMAKDIATVKKHTKKGSERAGMIRSIRRKQARKANQMHEG